MSIRRAGPLLPAMIVLILAGVRINASPVDPESGRRSEETGRSGAATARETLSTAIDSIASRHRIEALTRAAASVGGGAGPGERVRLHGRIRELESETEDRAESVGLYVAKIEKELSDLIADPCGNGIIAYCLIAARSENELLDEAVDGIVAAGARILGLDAYLGETGEGQRGRDVSGVVAALSRAEGLRVRASRRLAGAERRVAEYGCDESELERLAGAILPGSLEPSLLQDGGMMIEFPGDGADNDMDGLQEEDWLAQGGYNVVIELLDSEGRDDIFDLSLTGFGYLGRTEPGGLRYFPLRLPPGEYTAEIRAVRAPDGVGNFMLTVRERGYEVARGGAGLEEGASTEVTFTVIGR